MKMPATNRSFARYLLPLLCVYFAAQFCVDALPAQGGNHPAPVVRMPANPNHVLQNSSPSNARTPGPPRGAHLGQWMQQHGNLSSQQQQRALENEPGFKQLPPQTQQRMMQRLNRLNSMPEQQRERVISRNEFLEQMTPQQRGAVRSAMGQLGTMPLDRRHMVQMSFRELRSMPPEERNSLLNSPEYRQRFSDEERGTLGNLLSVSPLLPGSR